MQQRIQKNPFLDLFDGPDGNIQFAERRATTTTLQAMFFMNSEFIHERSEKIAARAISAGDDALNRVRWSYQTIFGRPPNSDELDQADRFLAEASAHIAATNSSGKSTTNQAWAAYLRGMISSNEFLFID